MQRQHMKPPIRFFFLVGTLALLSGCLPNGFVVKPISTNQNLREETLYSESLFPDGAIAIIDVEGVLINAETPSLLMSGEHPVAKFLEELDKARRSHSVKAVVLRVNSPGGSVTASELMHNEIMRFRESGKPVVVMMMDVAASGAYYISCAADEIIACRSTVTGSIGVIMQTIEFTGTMQKIGMKADAITSGPMKAAGNPLEPLTPEQREVFQNIVNSMYAQFVDVVAAGRPKLSREQAETLADGRVYTAEQALGLGLIDRIGSMQDAIAVAKQRAGVRNARIVSYIRPYGYVANYYGSAPASPPSADLNLLKVEMDRGIESARSPFMYLWEHP